MENNGLMSVAKKHAVTIFLLALVALLLANQLSAGRVSQLGSFDSGSAVKFQRDMVGGVASEMALSSYIVPPEQFAPTPSQDRLVITDTSLSMVVADVAQSLQQIRQRAQELDGFLVDSYLNAPEGADTGSITVRVPADRLDDALETFRGLAVRVTSENVSGQDVTDQYEDLEARLEVLEKTKAKFETLLDEVRSVQDSLQVQRELISLQQQIDSIKGRQQFLERSAEFVRITAFLATDELSLPYTPDEAWRPQVVFRLAVRGLVQVFQDIGTGGIWLAVFAPLWLPALLLIRWLAKRFS